MNVGRHRSRTSPPTHRPLSREMFLPRSHAPCGQTLQSDGSRDLQVDFLDWARVGPRLLKKTRQLDNRRSSVLPSLSLRYTLDRYCSSSKKWWHAPALATCQSQRVDCVNSGHALVEFRSG